MQCLKLFFKGILVFKPILGGTLQIVFVPGGNFLRLGFHSVGQVCRFQQPKNPKNFKVVKVTAPERHRRTGPGWWASSSGAVGLAMEAFAVEVGLGYLVFKPFCL